MGCPENCGAEAPSIMALTSLLCRAIHVLSGLCMLKRNSCGFSGRSSLRNSSEHPANGSTKDPLAAKQRGHSSTSPGLRGSRVNGSPHSRQVTVFLAGMEQALFLVRLQPSRINAPEHRSWHSDVKPSADAFETRANVMKAIQGHILAKAVYWGLFRRPQ